MKIRIDRPIDPELRRQWDEAKRACEERDVRPHNLELDLVDSGTLGERSGEQRWRWRCSCGAKGTWRNSALAARIDGAQRMCLLQQPDPSCCVGDRSQCRCSPSGGGWSDEDVEREKWIAVWNQTEDDR